MSDQLPFRAVRNNRAQIYCQTIEQLLEYIATCYQNEPPPATEHWEGGKWVAYKGNA